MSNINEQINNTRAVAAMGKNPLVAQLASKRVYDEALKNLDQLDRRPKVNFPLVVNTDHIRLVTEAYPEFSINFTGSKCSVHSLAGGLRALELEYLMLQIPYGSPCFDIGGNFTTHLLKGRSYVHCCNPMLDVKDVARVSTYHDTVHKYATRVTGAAKDSISSDSASCSRGRNLKPLPQFQYKAFERFNKEPKAVSCNDVFQECQYDFNYGQKRYAISLHSIYDIPYEDIGPSLLRKNIDFLYTAFHFSEELLLGYDTAEMNEIGAFFTRDGDDVHFMFGEESTLHYTHNFVNLRKIVTRTFFHASDSVIYIKEFLVKRVNTFYFRLAKVNTHMLHKSVAVYPDLEKKKNNYFALKSSPIFKDKATFSVWFPKAKGKVVLPIFKQAHFISGRVSVEKVLVDSNFVFTIYNHICTYDNKALTWRNVQSFVESIRSRVVVNGVSVKSEWDVPIEFLTDISFTLFMLVKAKKTEVEFLEGKFDSGKSLYERFVSTISESFGMVGETLKGALMSTGWFSSLGDELVISTPELFMTFHDYLTGVFEADAEVERANVESVLDATDSLYEKISDLCSKYSGLDFDVEKFREFCEKFDVAPCLITEVIEGIFSANCGVTIAGGRPVGPEANAAMAVSPLPVLNCEELMDTSDDDEIILYQNFPQNDTERCFEETRYAEVLSKTASSTHYKTLPGPGYGLVRYFLNNGATLPKQWAEIGRANLPQRGISVRKNVHTVSDDVEGHICLSKLHFSKIVDLKLRETITPVLYTGTIRVRQMNNYLDYLSASLGAVIGNLERIVLSDLQVPGETLQTYGLYDCVTETWILKPNDKGHQWAVVLATDGTTRIILLTYDENGAPIIEKEKWVRFAVSTDTKLYSTIRSLEVLSSVPVEEPKAEIVLVDGVPGCGKTAEIIEKVDWKTDLVLTPGKEASAMIRRRANTKFRSTVATNENVRTFDSFVMRRGAFCFNTLWVDEGLMVHTGLLNFAVNMSGCKRAYVYGDQKQIPFINRVTNFDYPTELSRIIVDKVEKRHVTKRCPRDITKFLNSVYKSAVSTTSAVVHSVSVHMLPGPALFRPELTRLEGKIVTFTQSDKFTLLKAGYPDVNTVHEIQGETYPVVSLVRVTVTPVQIINSKSPHVVVALTRHTEAMKYYTIVADCVVSILQDLEGVDQSILSMFTCVSGSK